MTAPIRTSADGPDREPPDCNLCGRTCLLGRHPHANSGGLERAVVRGNFDSTPGNGPPGAALDDCTAYSFSLCEHCLDFLFRAFAVPPVVRDTTVDGTPVGAKEFVSAAERVERDEWRRSKDLYRYEAAARADDRADGVARALGQDCVLRRIRKDD